MHKTLLSCLDWQVVSQMVLNFELHYLKLILDLALHGPNEDAQYVSFYFFYLFIYFSVRLFFQFLSNLLSFLMHLYNQQVHHHSWRINKNNLLLYKNFYVIQNITYQWIRFIQPFCFLSTINCQEQLVTKKHTEKKKKCISF